MDDYYELLGVDEDAPVDDIRSAYRDKKAAVDTSASDDAKSDVAALNRAWNVLSDPYQRGRYDQQRGSVGDEDDDDYEYEDEEEEDNATPVARSRSARGADRAEKRRNARQPLKPTVKLPAGMHLSSRRRRLIAFAIDMAILVGLFFVGYLAVLPAVEKSQNRVAYDRAHDLAKEEIPAAQDVTSAAKKEESAAQDKVDTLTEERASSSEIQDAKDDVKAANAKVDAAEKKEDNLNDQLVEQNKKLTPQVQLVISGIFLLALIILVVPSIFGRQTIGKQRQGIRVVRLDGSPARFGDVLRRYGVLVLAALALSLFLGPPGALVVAFFATMWSRNPNQQGLHDRLAKTLVVSDDEA